MKANAPTNDGYWTDAGNYATSFAGGSGAENDPYLISTPQQLAYLSYLVNNSSTNSQYASLYYEQTADLDMSSYYMEPIGKYNYSPSYEFKGTFNGSGYTISGLYIGDGEGTGNSFQGLFGQVTGESVENKAVICNVGIIDSLIQGYNYVGGIIGEASYVNVFNCYNAGSVISFGYSGGIVGTLSGSTISHCYNLGNISTKDGAYCDYIGGIVGSNGGEIINCYNEGNVSSTSESVGGIAGRNSVNGNIINCYNTGAIDSETKNIGGIAGENSGEIMECFNTGSIGDSIFTLGGYEGYVGGIVGDSSGIIKSCYNTGRVVSSGGYNSGLDVGGIAGRSTFEISDCYNRGSVIGYENIGGIAGYSNSNLYGNGGITNCYNTGDISGRYAGGIAGCTRSKILNCYNVGDIEENYSGGIVGYILDSGTVEDCYWGGD